MSTHETGRISDALSAVERDLSALWAAEPGAPPKTRACTANLLLVTSEQHRERVTQLATELPVADYARTFVISLSPELAPWALDASVSAHCQKGEDGLVCAERIDLALGAMTMARAPSIVATLAMAEVPTVLIVLSGAPSVLVAALAEGASRVVFDSDALGLDAAGVLVGAARGHVCDLAWERLHPYRNAIAACFDEPALRHAVTAVRRVTITSARTSVPASMASMPLASRRLFGWLGSRLGWRFIGQHTAVDPRHATIEIASAFRDAEGVPPGSVVAIEIVAELGDSSVTFAIERGGDPATLTTSWDAGEHGHQRLTTPLSARSNVELIDRAITDPTPDHVLRRALEVARATFG